MVEKRFEYLLNKKNQWLKFQAQTFEGALNLNSWWLRFAVDDDDDEPRFRSLIHWWNGTTEVEVITATQFAIFMSFLSQGLHKMLSAVGFRLFARYWNPSGVGDLTFLCHQLVDALNDFFLLSIGFNVRPSLLRCKWKILKSTKLLSPLMPSDNKYVQGDVTST